jgi:hypothetical protein
VLAALVGFLGDFDLAEEAAQEAFVVAAERWARDGPGYGGPCQGYAASGLAPGPSPLWQLERTPDDPRGHMPQRERPATRHHTTETRPHQRRFDA